LDEERSTLVVLVETKETEIVRLGKVVDGLKRDAEDAEY